MPEVTINAEQELYVIPAEGGVTCLGFDGALDELDRITIERVGRGGLDESNRRNLMQHGRRMRGTLAVYETLHEQCEKLRRECERDGESAVYNLAPQLTGLEGWRVEVVDTEGDEPRQFTVVRSKGWAPRHWEITSHAVYDKPARREYHSVEKVEKVL